MQAARSSTMGQQADLRAQLRTDDGRTPFTISLHDGVVSYTFTNPDQQIQLSLGKSGSELRERMGGKTGAVKPARYDEKVRGTAITYEDLALKLLYWPRPKLLGEENVSLMKAWKIEMQAPRGESQYAVARVWIGKDNGAVLKIEAFNKDGRRVKLFVMTSGQPISGRWMLKTMRVEPYDPNTGKVIDDERTYLDVLGEIKS